MAMHVNWVTARVEVIDYDFDDVMEIDNLGIRCLSIDDRIRDFVAGAQGGEEGWDLLLSVGCIINRKTMGQVLVIFACGAAVEELEFHRF